MSMFDYVVYSAPCPLCGVSLTEWQSKSGDRLLNGLTPAQLWRQGHKDRDPIGVKFYGDCPTCGLWVDITLTPAAIDYNEQEMAEQRRRLQAGDYRAVPNRLGPLLPDDEDHPDDLD